MFWICVFHSVFYMLILETAPDCVKPDWLHTHALPAGSASQVLHLKECAAVPAHLELELMSSDARSRVSYFPSSSVLASLGSTGMLHRRTPGKFQADQMAPLWNTENEKSQGNTQFQAKKGEHWDSNELLEKEKRHKQKGHVEKSRKQPVAPTSAS